MSVPRRDVIVGAAATAVLGLLPGKALAAPRSGEHERVAAYHLAYRQAFAEFEAAVRPSSEVYWASYNRAVAEVHARGAAARRTRPDGIATT